MDLSAFRDPEIARGLIEAINATDTGPVKIMEVCGTHTVSIAIGNGGPGVRGPYSTEPARLQALLLAMQGVGKPGVHQFKMIEWGLYNRKSSIPLPWPKYVPNVLAANRGLHRGHALTPCASPGLARRVRHGHLAAIRFPVAIPERSR